MKNPSDRLNPRRQLYADRLLDYLAWNGRKVFLTPDRYRNVCDETKLSRFAIDQAADDCFELGWINIAMAGEIQVLTLLLTKTKFGNGGRK